MSASNSGDGHFFVGISPVIARNIKRLQRQATREGRGDAFLSAFKTLIDRLGVAPHNLGEALFPLPNLELWIRLAVLRPVCIDFAVHDREPYVFLKSVKLLGDFGF